MPFCSNVTFDAPMFLHANAGLKQVPFIDWPPLSGQAYLKSRPVGTPFHKLEVRPAATDDHGCGRHRSANDLDNGLDIVEEARAFLGAALDKQHRWAYDWHWCHRCRLLPSVKAADSRTYKDGATACGTVSPMQGIVQPGASAPANS